MGMPVTAFELRNKLRGQCRCKFWSAAFTQLLLWEFSQEYFQLLLFLSQYLFLLWYIDILKKTKNTTQFLVYVYDYDLIQCFMVYLEYCMLYTLEKLQNLTAINVSMAY